MARNKPKIWQIVAYDDSNSIDKISELDKNLGIVAIGWYEAGNLKNKNLSDKKVKEKLGKKLRRRYGKSSNWKSAPGALQRFKSMEKDDLIILYKKRNTIACVGTVAKNKDYKFYNKNVIGNINDYGYPHQRSVNWHKSPSNFKIELLPKKIREKIGKRGGGTIHQVHGFSVRELQTALKEIPKIKTMTGLPVDESEIKEHMIMFLDKKINKLESGLQLIKKEHVTRPGRRADFLAMKDSKDIKIEVKTIADSKTIRQLKSYMKRGDNGIILANEFDEKCKRAILRSDNIRGFSCKSKLVFDEIRPEEEPEPADIKAIRGKKGRMASETELMKALDA